jgi:hypothetical protein
MTREPSVDQAQGAPSTDGVRAKTVSVVAQPGDTLGDLVEQIAQPNEPFERFVKLLRGERLHPRECLAPRRDGEPCRAWAMRGEQHCRAHADKARQVER